MYYHKDRVKAVIMIRLLRGLISIQFANAMLIFDVGINTIAIVFCGLNTILAYLLFTTTTNFIVTTIHQLIYSISTSINFIKNVFPTRFSFDFDFSYLDLFYK